MRFFTIAAATVAAFSCTAAAQNSGEIGAVSDAGTYHCDGSNGYAASYGGRSTFLWRPQWLEGIAADPQRRTRIIEEADEALLRGPYSVTNKGSLVPGATPHDYTSIGPYWWPDTSTPDGLPYKRRDGEVNPERNGPDFDKDRLRNLGSDMVSLSLGFHLTGDERYAEHAVLLLRTWFLDPATRMSPNMDFAQGIPGRVNGRGEGIIEASDLSTIVESIGLLGPSAALTPELRGEMQAWFVQFATWLATSDNGTSEMQKTNNHGVFFDFYLAHFALFAGLDSVTRDVAGNFLEFRLGRQMDRQGRFLAELRRTRSWHYSNYIVAGAGRLATISECVDIDLWDGQLDDGRSLQTANAFLNRYANDLQAWPFPDRDHTQQDYDRMRSTHRIVELLFARGSAFTSGGELP